VAKCVAERIHFAGGGTHFTHIKYIIEANYYRNAMHKNCLKLRELGEARMGEMVGVGRGKGDKEMNFRVHAYSIQLK